MNLPAINEDGLPNINSPTIEESGLSGIEIIENIKEYNSKTPIYLAILTPCFGGQCYVNYVTSLMNTLTLFTRVGIQCKVEFVRNESLITRARNNLIAKAMSDKAVTHMMFIDADITWNPIDIFKLILADKPIVGGLYPIKSYEWDRLTENPGITQKWIDAKNASQLKSSKSDADIIQHKLVRYNVNYLTNTLQISNNLARVKHLATGFMMIQRETITKMFMAFPSTKCIDDIGCLQEFEYANLFALFDCGVEKGHYFSEDWLFCSRWSNMGGEIWIDVTIDLNHTGIVDFKGSYLASLT